MSDAAMAEKDLAHWLLNAEMGDTAELAALVDAAERVCQKFSSRLALIFTLSGYRALLTRALILTRATFPFLEGVKAGTTSALCFEGLHGPLPDVETPQMHAAMTTVLAAMIGLLITFIGEDLTLRLIRNDWPAAPFGGFPPDTSRAQV